MTREDILEAAAQVFRRKGFHGASMQDIADAVLFLASPSAKNISGEFLLIDSGMHLNMTGTKR